MPSETVKSNILGLVLASKPSDRNLLKTGYILQMNLLFSTSYHVAKL